ncbi:MAG: hypothetical protein WCR74_21470 [Betaproteobacteria bacterium]
MTEFAAPVQPPRFAAIAVASSSTFSGDAPQDHGVKRLLQPGQNQRTPPVLVEHQDRSGHAHFADKGKLRPLHFFLGWRSPFDRVNPGDRLGRVTREDLKRPDAALDAVQPTGQSGTARFHVGVFALQLPGSAAGRADSNAEAAKKSTFRVHQQKNHLAVAFLSVVGALHVKPSLPIINRKRRDAGKK